MFTVDLANRESRRVCELVAAYDEHAITIREFGDTVAWFAPEVLQVAATVLSLWAENHPERSHSLLPARGICSRLAVDHRSMN